MNGDRNAPRHQKTPDRRGRAKIKRESVGGEGARMKKKWSLSGNQKHALLTSKSKSASSSECKRGVGGWREIQRQRWKREKERGEVAGEKLAELTSSLSTLAWWQKGEKGCVNKECHFFLKQYVDILGNANSLSCGDQYHSREDMVSLALNNRAANSHALALRFTHFTVQKNTFIAFIFKLSRDCQSEVIQLVCQCKIIPRYPICLVSRFKPCCLEIGRQADQPKIFNIDHDNPCSG